MKNISMLSQRDNKLNGVIRTLADVTFQQYCHRLFRGVSSNVMTFRALVDSLLSTVCEASWSWACWTYEFITTIIFWLGAIVNVIGFYLFTILGININPRFGYSLQDLHPSILYWAKVYCYISQGLFKFSPLKEVYAGRGRRFYSTSKVASSGSSLPLDLCKGKLHPWFITGFLDAESCFLISIAPPFFQKVTFS